MNEVVCPTITRSMPYDFIKKPNDFIRRNYQYRGQKLQDKINNDGFFAPRYRRRNYDDSILYRNYDHGNNVPMHNNERNFFRKHAFMRRDNYRNYYCKELIKLWQNYV